MPDAIATNTNAPHSHIKPQIYAGETGFEKTQEVLVFVFPPDLSFLPSIMASQPSRPSVQPCRYKTGKTLGAGSYSVVKECVHIDTGKYYAAKVINKRLMAGREHMVSYTMKDLPMMHSHQFRLGAK